jgi:hypothetical protein
MYGRAKRVGRAMVDVLEETLVLIAVGGSLGAVTGTVCLMLLGLPRIREWRLLDVGKILFLGSFVGAPLGAVCAPVLGWLLLRRVPVKQTLKYTPVGTLIGSLGALLLGWMRDDISSGAGLLYLVGGAIIGLVSSAVILWTRVAPDDPVISFTQW